MPALNRLFAVVFCSAFALSASCLQVGKEEATATAEDVTDASPREQGEALSPVSQKPPSTVEGLISQGNAPAGASQNTSPQSPAPQQGWSGIIGNGQSLSVGYGAALLAKGPVIEHAWMLADSAANTDLSRPHSPTLQLAALQEPIRTQSNQAADYPRNIMGKTPHAAMAQQIDQQSQAMGAGAWTTVHAVTGISGMPMAAITKNGTRNSYAAGLFEARALSMLAGQSNINLHFDAVIFTHGETDAGNLSTNYEQELIALQAAYQADLSAVQNNSNSPIYLILTQQHTFPISAGLQSAVTQAQWQAAVHHPEAIVCAGPKYQYAYGSDHLHFNAANYDRLGEKYGQVFAQTVIAKKPFKPLYPTSIVRPDAVTITITFHVPTPPLNWDNVLPKPHQTKNTVWALGRGFEVRGEQGQALGIKTTTIDADGQTVTIGLYEPHREALSVSYAMTADDDGLTGGLGSGRMGHLRDSDPVLGASLQTISCSAVTKSRQLRCAVDLTHRAVYDVVQPGDYSIAALVSTVDGTEVTLDRPWEQPTATYMLQFHHEQRNYAVSFGLPVAAMP